MKPVTIYTTTTCGYCRLAKDLLRDEGVPFAEIDVTHDAARRRWLVEQSGQRTVPQVFFGDESIGGFDELSELRADGVLDARLGRP